MHRRQHAPSQAKLFDHSARLEIVEKKHGDRLAEGKHGEHCLVLLPRISEVHKVISASGSWNLFEPTVIAPRRRAE